MQPIRVAILGQGRSGRDIHGYALTRLPELYQIVAVVDDLPARRERAEQEYGCTAYAELSDLFLRNDIDLIVNALPSSLHVPVTLDCLEHGFNVLCEKPLARRAKDADLLIAAAEKAGKTLAIFQQSRFSPAFQKILNILQSGALGRVVQCSIAFNGFSRRWDWQTLKRMNGGNLLNTGPHPVDQALQIFGTDVMPNILCRMDQANTAGDAEDYVKLVLHGANRPVVDVEISSCEAYPMFTYHIQATNGGLTGNTSHLSWRYFRPEEATEQTLVTTPLEKADGTPAYCGESLEWYEESWDIDEEQGRDLFLTMAHTFYGMLSDTLTKGVPLRVTPEEVRQQIAVMEECFKQNPKFDVE